MPSKTYKKKIKVEVADTPADRTTGLMYRKNIDPDSGMLFVFDSKKKLSFWGANTYVPLDIAFIEDDKIVDIKRIVPLSTKPVKCDVPCNHALEVASNFFDSNDIHVGSCLVVEGDEITFLS